jgi:hypothetical protein
MKLPFSEPELDGTERAKAAKAFRDLATEVARTRPHAVTKANGEEDDHHPIYPANFTKGLKHDEYGLLDCPEDYRYFVEAINSPDRNLFETRVRSAVDRTSPHMTCADDQTGADLFNCTITEESGGTEGAKPKWRGWESPRSGHAFDLEGPDAGAVGMAPAPRIGSSELTTSSGNVSRLALRALMTQLSRCVRPP